MAQTKKHQNPIEYVEDAIEDEVKELKKEYRRFERFRDENSLLFGIFVLGIAALVVINTVFWVYFSTEQYKQHQPKVLVPIHDSIVTSLESTENNVLSARVKNVTTNSRHDPAFTLPSNQTMLIMDFTISNHSNDTQQLIPSTQLYVRSREGQTFELHASMHVKKPLAAQDLSPGETAKGEISFAVPKRLNTPLLYIDTGWSDSTPLVIDVLH